MGDRIHALAQQLTGKDRLEECSVEELRHIVNRHPYFAPAQFLLLQKLRQSGTPDEADAQYRKAVLYYHDPLLFEQFIASNKFYTEELHIDVANDLAVEQKVVNGEEEMIRSEELGMSSDPTEVTNVPDDILQQEASRTSSFADLEKPTPTLELDLAAGEKTEQDEKGEGSPEMTENDQPVKEEQEDNQVDEILASPVTPLMSEPAPATGQELTFEPFHTVDYFASQGIKISKEELPKDKLGKQLKSFTEWLKTMKRLPATQVAQNVETAAEKNVESLADRSVSESDVVTEAMAEVWLKQGNTGKALDIYNKLSLLNPSKKAYFVAKIENLKQS